MILDAGPKLIYHSDRIHEIRTKGFTNPVHLTIGLTNYCNHRCVWCYIDFIRDIHKKKINADRKRLCEVLSEAREMGIKAITFVGDGEPTLHQEFTDVVTSARKIGYDIGIFTNGAWKNNSITKTMVENMVFIRFSVDAGTDAMHKATHGSGDFERVLSNMREVLAERNRLRRSGNLPTVGVQFAISHLNYKDALTAVRLFKDMGVDYIAFKPVYKNELNSSHEKNKITPEILKNILERVQPYSGEEFKVYWKEWQMAELVLNKQEKRSYDKCNAIWLSPYIDEDGNVEFCGNLKGRGYTIGNIYESSFKSIWGSKEHIDKINNIDLEKCPRGCKLHGINLKLWEIFHPQNEDHVNFI